MPTWVWDHFSEHNQWYVKDPLSTSGSPASGVIQADNGIFYGTMPVGGNGVVITTAPGGYVTGFTSGFGTIFSVNVSLPLLTLGCPSATASVGVAYTSALTAANGVPPYTFSIYAGTFPSGLTLNTTTGAVTGTPVAAAGYYFGAEVTDSQGVPDMIPCLVTVKAVPRHSGGGALDVESLIALGAIVALTRRGRRGTSSVSSGAGATA